MVVRLFLGSRPAGHRAFETEKSYRMPSYAHLSEQERQTLAAYVASLKVQDWYLEETRKAEYEKLTGKPYPDRGDRPDEPQNQKQIT